MTETHETEILAILVKKSWKPRRGAKKKEEVPGLEDTLRHALLEFLKEGT